MTRPEAIAFDKATNWLRRFKRPLLVSHRNPDGDALGSLAAMRLLLGHSNISATPVLFDDISSRYAMFNRYEPMPIWNAASAAEDWANIDCVILLDTCSKAPFGPGVEEMDRPVETRLVFRDELPDREVVVRGRVAIQPPFVGTHAVAPLEVLGNRDVSRISDEQQDTPFAEIPGDRVEMAGKIPQVVSVSEEERGNLGRTATEIVIFEEGSLREPVTLLIEAGKHEP